MTYLATVDILNGALPEEEIDKVGSLERPDELGLVKPLAVKLLRPESGAGDSGQAPGYCWVSSGEIHGTSNEIVLRASQQCSDVGFGTVGAAGNPSHPLEHVVHILDLSPKQLTLTVNPR